MFVEYNKIITAHMIGEYQSFPRSVGHVVMSSKSWFDPVKGYSLLDQMTCRNLSYVEYVNVL